MAPKKKKIRHESPLTAEATGAISSGGSDSRRKKKSGDQKPMSKRAQIRAKKEAMEKEEEERLTALLFGGGAANENENSSHGNDSDEEDEYEMENIYVEDEEGGEFAFEIDRGGQASSDDENASAEGELAQAWNDEDDDDEDDGEHSIDMNDDDSEASEKATEESAPAWEDADDAKTALIDGNSRLKKLRRTRDEIDALSSHELEQRLRQRYEVSSQSTARTDWATKTKKKRTAVDKESDDEEDADEAALSLFSTSKSLLASSRNQLPPNVLNIVRCPDANLVDPNKAVVRCIDFHPGSEPDQPLMLTAGLDKTLRFFQVGEEKSEKIHGIHCKCILLYCLAIVDLRLSHQSNCSTDTVKSMLTYFKFCCSP